MRDDATRWVGHQTAHASQLCDRAEATLGRAGLFAITLRLPSGSMTLLHRDCHMRRSPRARFDGATLVFLFGHQTAAILALHFLYLASACSRIVVLLFRHGDVADGDADTRSCGVLKADVFNVVHKCHDFQ